MASSTTADTGSWSEGLTAQTLTSSPSDPIASGIITRAQNEYPSEDIDTAVKKFILKMGTEGICFLNDSGERCIFGAEIRYSITKGHNGGKGLVEMYAPRKEGRRGDDRKYVHRRYPLTLKQTNRPKREELAEIVRHISESGWNQPVGHARHFDKFPEEIKRLIFGFALTAPGSYSLRPFVVTCNWVRRWCAPDYAVGSGSEYLEHRSKIWVPRRDANGPYTEIHRIYRKPIDASFLRTCKTMAEMGNKILYGGNELYFRMSNPGCIQSPPSLMARGVYRPNANKPENSEDWKDQVDKIITQIENQVPLCALTGWAYYDPFLRFLYTIGSNNARHIKSLKFEGTIKLHLCSVDCLGSEACDDDLVWSLQLYIPFIQKFCTAVEKLTLCVDEDVQLATNMHLYPPGHPLTYEEALLPLLCNGIREIESLKEIAIIHGGWSPEDNNIDLRVFKPAELWFQKRTRKRAYNAVKELRSKLEAAEAAKNNTKPTCEFCSEDHIWAKCHNLCNFCGEFGHLRRTCPMRKL